MKLDGKWSSHGLKQIIRVSIRSEIGTYRERTRKYFQQAYRVMDVSYR